MSVDERMERQEAMRDLYAAGHTMAEIAELYALSRSRICQIINPATLIGAVGRPVSREDDEEDPD
jgi:hypothetical protein